MKFGQTKKPKDDASNGMTLSKVEYEELCYDITKRVHDNQ